MATIVIDDLIESADLDKRAMSAVSGGAAGSGGDRSRAGGFTGRGKPIDLSAPAARPVNQRLRHSKCAKA